jgi:hypothetical protein
MLQALLALALVLLVGATRVYIFGERPKVKVNLFKFLLMLGLATYAYASAYLVIGLFL